jgi:hypothetical protein
VRQIIKDYAFESFENETLREAVRLWCRDRAAALRKYGDINDWDVSQVTDMSSLFAYSNFNDRIDRWDVFAKSFNQPLDTWDVSHVTTMENLFHSAAAFNQSLATWDVSRVSNMQFIGLGLLT